MFKYKNHENHIGQRQRKDVFKLVLSQHLAHNLHLQKKKKQHRTRFSKNTVKVLEHNTLIHYGFKTGQYKQVSDAESEHQIMMNSPTVSIEVVQSKHVNHNEELSKSKNSLVT